MNHISIKVTKISQMSWPIYDKFLLLPFPVHFFLLPHMLHCFVFPVCSASLLWLASRTLGLHASLGELMPNINMSEKNDWTSQSEGKVSWVEICLL